MTERGGPTTQAGIHYQNSVSALYMGRMCDAAPRPDRERVVELRVDAPTEVDDTIVRFADDHRTYIQVKLDVRQRDMVWRKLWKDFDAQFRQEGFERGSDRLLLWVGVVRPEHYQLQQLCQRGATSEDFEELWVTWAREASDEKNAAVLLDSAGMGKTVVMHDALRALEAANFSVLAIKADQQLSGIATDEDLRQALGLSDRVEEVVGRLAALGPVVVLLDQVDALSLSLARDQKTLNVVLGTVARLRLFPNVRVLFSCRAFDLNSDPRLKRVEVARRFDLEKFADEEVAGVLREEGVDFATLSPATRELLRVPLHLDLFLRALEERPFSGTERSTDGISTLQDLYALLWREVVLAPHPESPPVHEREQVLRLMTDYMDREQRTSVPQSVFSRPDAQHLDEATRWLGSAGILMPTDTGWSFLHQTFFDYCYARQFVDAGRSLSESILAGDQGLFARPQLLQVLAYLRGSGSPTYLRELNLLFRAEGLRFHLKELLFGWFGALADPTDDEWLLARRMLADPATRPKLLKAMQANPGWFARLRGHPMQDLLAEDDEVLDAEVLPYLISMVDLKQEEVVSLLRPFLGWSDRWNNRVRWALARIRDWHTLAAVELFEQLLREVPASEVGNFYELNDVVEAFPREGCRMIRLVLDRSLDAYLESGEWRYYCGLLRDMPLHDYTLQEAFKAASTAAPGNFVEAVLPWLERVYGLTNPTDDERPYFAPDVLSHGWYDGLDNLQDGFIRATTDALTALAETQPDHFRTVADRLAAMPYQTPQQLLAHVYRAMPEAYAEDASRFLLDDRRRLNLGDPDQYDSRKLISAIYPFLTEDQQAELEAYIISWNLILRYRGLEGLRWLGLERLYLLQAIPSEYLTDRGTRYLGELERKFPGVRASEKPLSIGAQLVGSPIDKEAHAIMSDKAWLRAMKKYHGNVRHRDVHKGGAYQLAACLQRLTKEEPERFYRLAMRVPDDVDDEYAAAFINGLAEAEDPAEWLFDVVDRFGRDPTRDIKRTVAWALEKRSDEGLRGDMTGLLEDVVRGPMGDDDPSGVYLNSDRGASMRTLMRTLDSRDDDGDRERMWALIEHAADDPSSALRAGAIEELLYRLLTEDRGRAVELFERLMDGHPALLCDHDATSFMYYGSYKHFLRMEPFIRALMNHEDEKCAQRGAELACVAAISSSTYLQPFSKRVNLS
jgi:hypothetical protein